ncbi:hypothetical protein GA0061081_102199 [Gilliamella bombicola]|uniref:Uncharacterized protein n=1 Tax=Gilliamella bombicola TaxID=1798182 RepID=A0A1C4A1K6_9GAMM|nr:DUF6246 family protein [Gilliamella bombicola]SCB88461.1 hypothetical protein GA0061081_102199 [Gilliamella bombicola]
MKPVITDVGEFVIHTENVDYLFVPSFLNMTKLGKPDEIVEIFSMLFGEINDGNFASVIECADKILEACCTTDCSVITGYIKGEDELVNVEAVIPVEDKLILSQHLLKHGLIGDVPPKKTSEDADYSNEFHAKKFVYLAVAHLGMRELDAWNMSMTAFQEAMEAKFPANDKDIISQDDYDSAMSYADSVVGLVS